MAQGPEMPEDTCCCGSYDGETPETQNAEITCPVCGMPYDNTFEVTGVRRSDYNVRADATTCERRIVGDVKVYVHVHDG